MAVVSVVRKQGFNIFLTLCFSLFLLSCTKQEQSPDFYPQVLESNTHSPPSNYTGPKYDRIKKGVDVNKDGKPDSWVIYADSINDGMNLAFGPDDILFLVEKDSVIAFQDTNGDGVSDQRHVLLQLRASGKVYEHAAILGITYPPNAWLYISRGNTDGLATGRN